METPWGRSQHSKHFGPGVVFYGTAGHGGFHVAASVNALIPEYLRNADSYANGNAGWYEEDCAWALVVTALPDRFDAEIQASAKETLKFTYPDAYERFYGVVLQPGESYAKDERQFMLDHVSDYLVLSCFGDWHADVPKGFVAVYAGIGGRSLHGEFPATVKWFLVPNAEFKPKMVLSHGPELLYPEIPPIS